MNSIADNFEQASQYLKTPPHSIAAEQSVLGGLLLDNYAWAEIASRLQPEDFYHRDHQLFFQAIKSLAESNKPYDVITVSDWFEQRGQLESVGGLAYLGTLAKNTPSAANISTYADIVREYSLQRQLIRMGVDISNAAFNPEGRNVSQLLESAEQRFQTIASLARANRDYSPAVRPIREVLDDARIKAPPFIFHAYGNGWLTEASLIMVTAKTGAGKSVFVHTMTYALAMGTHFMHWENRQRDRRYRVLLIDGELPDWTLKQRFQTLVDALGLGTAPDNYSMIGLSFFERYPKPHVPEGKRIIREISAAFDVLIFDNVSTLFSSGESDDNSANDWHETQEYLISLREAGKTVILVNHAGKSNESRGTSKREDALDVHIRLTNDGLNGLEIECLKNRHGVRWRNIEAAIDERGVLYVPSLHSRLSGTNKVIFDLILKEGAMSIGEMTEYLDGYGKDQLKRACNRMSENGILSRTRSSKGFSIFDIGSVQSAQVGQVGQVGQNDLSFDGRHTVAPLVPPKHISISDNGLSRDNQNVPLVPPNNDYLHLLSHLEDLDPQREGLPVELSELAESLSWHPKRILSARRVLEEYGEIQIALNPRATPIKLAVKVNGSASEKWNC